MMSRLLALIGTLLLCGAAASASYWTLQVVQTQPELPYLGSAQNAPTETPNATDMTLQRRQHPEVFYTAVTDRPLFAPTRRPVLPAPEVQIVIEDPEPTPTPVSEPEKPKAPQLALLGVMGNANNNRALVSNAGGDPIWIIADAKIAGWTVNAIGTDWLEITLENETIRIEMYQQ